MKIVNRIVTFLLALGVFPVLFFRVLLRAVVSIDPNSSLYTILTNILKDTVDRKMEITLTLKQAIQYIQDGTFSFAGMDFSISKIPSELLVTKNWLIASGALLVVAIIIAIVIMGCSLFAQAHKTVICLGVGGMACVFAAMKCFSVFASPFTGGTVDLGSILAKALLGDNQNILSSLGSSFLEGSIKVDILQIGNAAIIMAIIFLAITLWTFAYFITLPEKERKHKVK